MNVAEIEQALEEISQNDFIPETFGIEFAQALGAPKVTIAKLKTGTYNRTDLDGGFLWKPWVHFLPAEAGQIDAAIEALKASKATTRQKARYLISTDGADLIAVDTKSGESHFCAFKDLGKNFGFFLPIAGYERFKAAEENPVDIKAASRLAKLYDAILRANPDWAEESRKHDLNMLMTRLIFCLFAEDTGILEDDIFSKTLKECAGHRGEDAQMVLATLFRTMNLKAELRSDLPSWAVGFPYVNGGLFAGDSDAPVMTGQPYHYLLEAGKLDWRAINPDIFGSMIQSVVDPKKRGELGMHYTSVPNIMKVLGPLFLNSIAEDIERAWNSEKKLKDVLHRLSTIRVFDPACGSGNFLVIAYRELRQAEMRVKARIAELRGETQVEMWSHVSLSQLYGIEYADFAAETAKLALWIAEYQMNSRHQDMFGVRPPALPLNSAANIRCGNSLRIDWAEVCPKRDGVETYIAGNPPFLGKKQQKIEQKNDMDSVFNGNIKNYRALDYVAAFFFQASHFIREVDGQAALVSTNSICQGASVPALWPHILGSDLEIGFGHRSFKWSNNASKNAAVTCVIVGIRQISAKEKWIYEAGHARSVKSLNAYLIEGDPVFIEGRRRSAFHMPEMKFGNMPMDGGNLILSTEEKENLLARHPEAKSLVRRFMGSQEVCKGLERHCLWISNDDLSTATSIPEVSKRIEKTRIFRLASSDRGTQKVAERSHQFREHNTCKRHAILVPSVSSERRPYLPCDIVGADTVSSNLNFALYDAPEWCLALIASRLHILWIGTVCGKLEDRFRYSNTLGWNTFPVPELNEADKKALTQSARRILTARAEHHPKSIADLYDPDKMPENLREAHRHNDELLERMYSKKAFRSDTERLEHLFARYAEKVEELKKDKAVA